MSTTTDPFAGMNKAELDYLHALAAENSAGTTPNALTPQTQTFIQQHPEFAWMATDPELGPLLSQSIVQNWDATRWQEALQGTNWFKTHSAAARDWLELAGSDPATADQRVQAEKQDLQAATSTLGVKLTDAQLTSLAYQSLEYGWTAQESQNHIAKLVTYTNGQFQVAPFYVDPSTGKAIDAFSGRQAYFGPNGEAATPDLATAQKWGAYATATFEGQTVYYQPVTSAEPWQTKVNGSYVDTRTGRPAYYGPNGEPGTPDQNAAAQAWGQGGFQTYQRDDGATIYYKAGTGATQATGGQGSAVPGGGLLGASVDQLKAEAAKYLVPVADTTLAQWAQQIASGQADVKGFDAYLQAQAKSLFPSMGTAIDQGITPQQYVDPYKQVASSLLGVNPNTIDMTDPKWMRAVGQKDPKTGMPVAMSLYDWQQTLMSDPTYGYLKTQNAGDRASALAEGIAQMFGRTPSGGTGFSGAAAPRI